MAHLAKVENGIVTQVIVVSNSYENDFNVFLIEMGLDGKWVQTSYNNNFRNKYASIGYLYIEPEDFFIEPSPYPSWTLDKVNMVWSPPIPMPEGYDWFWDEENQIWFKRE